MYAIKEALECGPSIQHLFNYFEKISHIPKINMANISKVQKALHHHIPKVDPSILYPIKYVHRYPVSLYFFVQYPCIPKKSSRASLNQYLYVHVT